MGRRARAQERLLRRGDEDRARSDIARVAMLAREIDDERLERLRLAIATAPDPSAAIARAAAGGVCDDVDFFELTGFLQALEDIARLAIEPAFADARPEVRAPELHAALIRGCTQARTFYLDDAYAPALASARAERNAAQEKFDAERSRLASRAAAYAGIENLRDGEFIVMRERVVKPLPPEIRVVREAPTYLLCELALDDAALASGASLDAAAARVADAEDAVRADLSRHIAAAASELERACSRLGALDLLVARVGFTRTHACTLPQIVDAAAVAFHDARYLPLAKLLAKRDRSYVALSLELSGVGVITGPNMGGKTAALRTVGFLAACVAYGVPVPARTARIPLFDEVAWLGIAAGPPREPEAADGHSGATLLSAFAGEIVAVQALLQRAALRPLVLIDEFAGTTSPREGRALLVALLATLRARGALALASTHFDRVAEAAHAQHYATGVVRPFASEATGVDLAEALERVARGMEYRLRPVAPDSPTDTGALALAGALGLDPDVLARARAAL